MKNLKNSLFYLFTISAFSALIYFISNLGEKLEVGRAVSTVESSLSHWQNFSSTITTNSGHSLPVLLMQIVIIILFARLLGWLCKKVGQPTVIGEILAGIALGPSLLGTYFPEINNYFFPIESLGNLNLLSQIGLILFMFVVGMELDLKTLNKKANDALLISHSSIIIPFSLGMVLAYYIYPTFSPQGVSFLPFALFLGIAMSITAFPVLARIIQERGLYKQKIGGIVITSAAIDDITAWCLLAVIIAIVKAGSFMSSLYTIGLAVLYVLLMIKGVRPFLKRIGDLHSSTESLSKPIVAIFFVVLLLSACISDIIGIHPLFGAFMAGVIMPQDKKFRYAFIQRVEDIALVLFLPLFFVYTGLRTEIGLLNDIHLWGIAGLIFIVAVLGKFLGSALAARFVGQSWRNSLIIGSLMNTRGLMELVALNIGYDLGVLSPEVFAMFVIMALLTTFMTGPTLNLIDKLFKDKIQNKTLRVSHFKKFDILLAFASPQIGKTLLRLADSLIKKQTTGISVLHLSPENTLYHYNIEEYEKESFTPILKEAGNLNRPITTLFKASNDVGADIAEMANNGTYNLLLISVGQSIFEGSLLGRVLGYTTKIINPEKIINKVTGKEKLFSGSNPFDEKTQQILLKSEIPVGVFMGKSFRQANYVVLVVNNINDVALFKYAQLFINNVNSYITIYDNTNLLKRSSEAQEALEELSDQNPKHIAILRDKKIDPDWLDSQDLMLISVEGWKDALTKDADWIEIGTSTLVIRP
jgi:Kef-type K+ transport system membrane component KefB